ncbi:helix-turn-helix domain-containing protein [Sphingopyxis sp.]|uniref:helix-turn-helix domain-containing protein n=1 Tax=Sphingopyxis sp. TaxID=1908224 RepID=UPI001D5F1EED|nr:helix-turn-helix domain-containing protein [Sphingopyxis sp.]MBW8296182.1 helix-turn-helix domain-containing protein [Sphingopyxis sp.]
MATDNELLQKLTYTISEFCQISGLGRTTVYMHINAGRLKTRMVGGRRLIPADSGRQFLLGDAA